jgi:hypothetical protein
MDNIPTKEYLDRLINRLKGGVVYINTNDDICRPYTLVDKDSDSLNKVWCLIHDRFESIEPNCVISYTFYTEQPHEQVQRDKDTLVNAPTDNISQKEVEELYFRTDIDNDTFNVLKEFKFAASVDSIREDNLSDDELEKVRIVWMDRIREERVGAFEELEELEEQAKSNSGSEDDDLEDIETIKQMFRDIPQDVDLSQYTTLKELVQFWPPLLLPSPPPIGILHQMLNRVRPAETDSQPAAQLVGILNDISDKDALAKFLKEFEGTGDSENARLAKVKISERLKQLHPVNPDSPVHQMRQAGEEKH